MRSIRFKDRDVEPSKLICIGRNYLDHIVELGNSVPDEMIVFGKPNSAIADQLHSHHQEPLHYEAELCFVCEYGKFAGVGFGLDLTKRALQETLRAKGLPWERCKAFKDSALFSEFVLLEGGFEELGIELRIDGDLIQEGGYGQMIYKPQQILEELKSFNDLEDGDVVMTGTPKGVGVVRKGARFEGRVIAGEKELVRCDWIAR